MLLKEDNCGATGDRTQDIHLKGCCSTAELPPQRCYNYTLSTAPSSSGPGRLAFIKNHGFDSHRGHNFGNRKRIGCSAGCAPPQTALQRHNSNSPRAAVKKNEEKRKNFKELLFINFNGATSWIQIRIASYCLIAPSKTQFPKSVSNINIPKNKTEKQVEYYKICFFDFRV